MAVPMRTTRQWVGSDMKYMGSKASLVSGALGKIISARLGDASGFVDLFSGSAAVSQFVAARFTLPVTSVDLQEAARVLAAAVVERTERVDVDPLVERWLAPAAERASSSLRGAAHPASVESISRQEVVAQREWGSAHGRGFVVRHYGGHYFSLTQAMVFDELLGALPTGEAERDLCLAAVLHAASRCAAAPGHTAQPFQPTPRLLRFIAESWRRDPVEEVRRALGAIAGHRALVRGRAIRGDASEVISEIPGDALVFCDPPYSAVQYSRFYHVLEGMARGGWSRVDGAGRAPHRTDRATSDFSMRRRADSSMGAMLSSLRERGCRVMITFPDAETSNALSADRIVELAGARWSVEKELMESSHSTLGGSGGAAGSRAARRAVKESVLYLTPR